MVWSGEVWEWWQWGLRTMCINDPRGSNLFYQRAYGLGRYLFCQIGFDGGFVRLNSLFCRRPIRRPPCRSSSGIGVDCLFLLRPARMLWSRLVITPSMQLGTSPWSRCQSPLRRSGGRSFDHVRTDQDLGRNAKAAWSLRIISMESARLRLSTSATRAQLPR